MPWVDAAFIEVKAESRDRVVMAKVKLKVAPNVSVAPGVQFTAPGTPSRPRATTRPTSGSSMATSSRSSSRAGKRARREICEGVTQFAKACLHVVRIGN